MSRAVTNAFIAACNAPTTDEGMLVLVTIEHDDLAAPIRIVNNGANVVSNGETFLACPFQPTLSDDSDDRPPQAKLVMDNIDRTLVAAVRSITTPPSITLQLVKISDLDTVEAEFTNFQMRDISYNELTIEGTLTLEGLFNEPVVGYCFTPGYFPGLFIAMLWIMQGINYAL